MQRAKKYMRLESRLFMVFLIIKSLFKLLHNQRKLTSITDGSVPLIFLGSCFVHVQHERQKYSFSFSFLSEVDVSTKEDASPRAHLFGWIRRETSNKIRTYRFGVRLTYVIRRNKSIASNVQLASYHLYIS